MVSSNLKVSTASHQIASLDEASLASNPFSDRVAQALGSLDLAQYTLLNLRYGLEGEAPLSTAQIAIRLDTTEPAVREAGEQALRALYQRGRLLPA